MIDFLSNPELRDLKADILDELKAFGVKKGITFRFGRGRKAADSADLQLVVTHASTGGKKPLTPQAEAFKRNASKLGLKASDLNKTFTLWDGQAYELVGANMRAPKNPLCIKRVRDGKGFKCPALEVVEGLQR